MGACGSRPKIVADPPAVVVDSDVRDGRLDGREYESKQLLDRINVVRKHQGWQAYPDLPEFMWELPYGPRKALIDADVRAVLGATLTDEQRHVVDDITRPIAEQIYNDSDRTEPSEHYWDLAQQRLFFN